MTLFGHLLVYLLYDLCKVNNRKTLFEFDGHLDISRFLFQTAAEAAFWQLTPGQRKAAWMKLVIQMRIFDTENIDLSGTCFILCLESAFSCGYYLRLHLWSTVEELSVKAIRHRLFSCLASTPQKKLRFCSEAVQHLTDIFLPVMFLALIISSFLYYKVCYLIITQ